MQDRHEPIDFLFLSVKIRGILRIATFESIIQKIAYVFGNRKMCNYIHRMHQIKHPRDKILIYTTYIFCGSQDKIVRS